MIVQSILSSLGVSPEAYSKDWWALVRLGEIFAIVPVCSLLLLLLGFIS